MTKLALLALAAGVACVPAVAQAQTVHHRGPNVTVHQQGGRFMHPGGFRHHRLRRGFFIHPFWFGPQFHVQNWQLYGFAPPPPDHRWVRHYDDAYMVDREGRVRDHHYGLDWDEYGERWEMEDGIPHYYGRGDWRPGEEDHAWVERHGGSRGDGGYEDGRHGGHGYGAAPGCAPAPPQPCGGYGYGYYGWGYAYPIIIETTVHTGAVYEEVVEEVVEVRQRQRQRRRPPPPRRPRPRPPAGERG